MEPVQNPENVSSGSEPLTQSMALSRRIALRFPPTTSSKAEGTHWTPAGLAGTARRGSGRRRRSGSAAGRCGPAAGRPRYPADTEQRGEASASGPPRCFGLPTG